MVSLFSLLFGNVIKIFTVRASRQLRELYSFSLLFSFAFSLVTIFEPVFFYQQGFSLAKIALYYALHYSLYVVLMPLGGKFAARFGLERTLALSTPFFVLYFLILAALPEVPHLFWLAFVVLTIHKIFYWPSFHADFSKFSDGSNRGTEQSVMSFVNYAAGITGPLVGGIVATHWGFSALFVMAAATVLVAGFPLLRTRERYQVVDFPYESVWRFIRAPRQRRMVITMCGMGEELIHLVFWPIFLFLVMGTPDKLGAVVSFSIIIATLWGFLVGELSDRFSERRVLRLAVPILVLGNVTRVLAVTPLRALAIDTITRMATVSVRTPMLARLYRNAQNFGHLRYALAFEMVLAIAKAVTAWLLVGLFVWVTPTLGLQAAFWLAAALALLYAFL